MSDKQKALKWFETIIGGNPSDLAAKVNLLTAAGLLSGKLEPITSFKDYLFQLAERGSFDMDISVFANIKEGICLKLLDATLYCISNPDKGVYLGDIVLFSDDIIGFQIAEE